MKARTEIMDDALLLWRHCSGEWLIKCIQLMYQSIIMLYSIIMENINGTYKNSVLKNVYSGA